VHQVTSESSQHKYPVQALGDILGESCSQHTDSLDEEEQQKLALTVNTQKPILLLLYTDFLNAVTKP